MKTDTKYDWTEVASTDGGETIALYVDDGDDDGQIPTREWSAARLSAVAYMKENYDEDMEAVSITNEWWHSVPVCPGGDMKFVRGTPGTRGAKPVTVVSFQEWSR